MLSLVTITITITVKLNTNSNHVQSGITRKCRSWLLPPESLWNRSVASTLRDTTLFAHNIVMEYAWHVMVERTFLFTNWISFRLSMWRFVHFSFFFPQAARLTTAGFTCLSFGLVMGAKKKGLVAASRLASAAELLAKRQWTTICPKFLSSYLFP